MHRALTETRPALRPAPGGQRHGSAWKQRSEEERTGGRRKADAGSARARAQRTARATPSLLQSKSVRFPMRRGKVYRTPVSRTGMRNNRERESVSLQLRLNLSLSARAREPWQAVFTQPLAHSVTARWVPPSSEDSLCLLPPQRSTGCHTTHLPADSQLCLSSWALFLYIKQENSSEHSSSSHLLPLSDQSFRNSVHLN